MSVYYPKENEVLTSKIRKTLVKIDVLNWNTERKVNSLEGDVISGNLSIDGNSAVRRTLNLVVNLTNNNYKLTDPANVLSINKKIKVFIGVKDLLKEFQPVQIDGSWTRKEDSDFVWYQIGIFIIIKPTSTISTSSQQVSLTLQDKGCLHNGTVGGMLQAPTRFDAEILDTTSADNSVSKAINLVYPKYQEITYETKDTAVDALITILNTKLNTISQDEYSIYLTNTSLVYQLKAALLVLKTTTTLSAFNAQQKVCSTLISSFISEMQTYKKTIYDIIKYAAITFGGEVPGRVIIEDVPNKIKTPITIPAGTYNTMSKDSPTLTFTEDTVGYKIIPYIYPDTLTFQAGEPVSKVYDSCNSALGGNYQYYYDPQGYFHFEEIKNYKYNRTPNVEDITTSDYIKQYNQSAVSIDFSNDENVASYNNALDYSNIKNDLTVSNTVDGKYIAYHLVIDKKPTVLAYDIEEDSSGNVTKYSIMDYREFIVHNYNTGTYRFIGKSKTKVGLLNFINNHPEALGTNQEEVIGYITDEVVNGYYLYSIETKSLIYKSADDITRSLILPDYYEELSTIWKNEYYDDHWHKSTAATHYYNFDIIDSDSTLKKFSINSIGRRTFSKTDQSIKSLMPTPVGDYMIITDYCSSDYEQYWFNSASTIDMRSDPNGKTSYENELLFPIYGSIYNDAFTAVKEQLFNKTEYNSQVTVTCLPYYWLDVNNRAKIYYQKAAIQGFYLINKISYNIDENSIMTVSLTEANVLEK